MALLLAAACARRQAPSPQAPAAAPAGATVLLATEPAGINELVSGGGRATQDLIDRLFLHLFEEQPDFADGPPTFAPRLATAWRWSEDRRKLHLDLRRDVRWSDGVPVTADDVRWTWQVQRDPRVGWRYADSKSAIEEVRVLGPFELEVAFARRSPAQLAALNEGVVLPRHAWSRLPLERWPSGAGWFLEHAVTNGPFRLRRWESQQRIVLERNPTYYEPDLPRLDEVLLRVVPLRGNRLAQLAAGGADFVAQLTPKEVAWLAGRQGVVVRQFWHRQYDYLAWNLRRPEFEDAAVRRALTAAIDRRELIDTLWGGRARLALSPILTSVWAHDASLRPWPYDPGTAREVFERAGWRPGADGRLRRGEAPFAFDILVNTGNPLHVDAALLVQAQLREVGIEAGVRRLDFHALIERLDAGDFDAAIGSWGIDTSLDLGYAFHSASITDGYNSGAYANPEVDRLIEAARAESDVKRRRLLLHELQRILHRDQPYTFLWEPPRFDGHSARLRGVQSNPLSSLFRLREWSVAPD